MIGVCLGWRVVRDGVCVWGGCVFGVACVREVVCVFGMVCLFGVVCLF